MVITLHTKHRIQHLIRAKGNSLPCKHAGQSTRTVINMLVGIPWQGEVPVHPGHQPESDSRLARFGTGKSSGFCIRRQWENVALFTAV